MTDITTACRPVSLLSTRISKARTPPGKPACARRSAFEVLYREERKSLLAYLASKVGKEQAKDLAQEVFLRAAASPQLTELGNPGGFLRRIARNLLIDAARRRNCRIRTQPLFEDSHACCDPEQEERIHAQETAFLLEKLLAGLPERTARIFAMNRFEQKSYRQIHAELGIALQTVDYHMMKALALLRAELNDRY
ncbi:MAG: sigma-70 family RNA polymerase sigma factor [Alphaproteobacteria bacterium]|nr:sigma-70 family RNA polymerase sigma factor [Alphaproteobacteria bacterium]